MEPEIEKMSINQKIIYLSLISALGVKVPSEIFEALAYEDKKSQIFPDPVLWLKLTNLNKMQAAPGRVIAQPQVNKNSEVAEEQDEKRQGELELMRSPPVKAEFVLSERLGERILLMGAIMEGAQLADMNPLVISEIIYGLFKAGLKKEARDLAMEVAISAGL